jgi:hypothetical protein
LIGEKQANWDEGRWLEGRSVNLPDICEEKRSEKIFQKVQEGQSRAKQTVKARFEYPSTQLMITF